MVACRFHNAAIEQCFTFLAVNNAVEANNTQHKTQQLEVLSAACIYKFGTDKTAESQAFCEEVSLMLNELGNAKLTGRGALG